MDFKKEFNELKESYRLDKSIGLAQRRKLIQLIDLYSPLVKREVESDELKATLREFLKRSNGLDALKVRNIFVSITTAKDFKGKTVTIREDHQRGGKQVIESELGGRPRVFNANNFILSANKKLKIR